MLACSAPNAGAQTPVRWTAAALRGAEATRAAAPEGAAIVRVTAAIDDGWHIYSLTQPAGGPVATRITLPAGQPYAAAGAVRSSRPHVGYDESFAMNVEMHERTAVFDVPVRATGGSAGSPANWRSPVQITVRYQACNASLCLPPQTARLSASLPPGRSAGPS